MTDETETGAQIDVVAPDAPPEAPKSKKQRAPRRSKAEIEAATAAKTPKVRQMRIGKAEGGPVRGTTTVSAATTKTEAKGPANPKPVRQPATPPAPLTASDDMADLLQLEEDNKKLRHALAEKLRAENADLRKRLGV
ncbi:MULTISPECIES: SyrB-like regulator [Rhizobium]|uniref:SyrB-like regulator n=1 Tax=Rhizobium rhododendri TaxID=2506430 RepID=A0ABY8IN91_9HYPH|nr:MULTISPECIES: SyrB-like regulator [Rhizobium]MBO9101048.1 SyrB-like regulator [Rhizobium sp. L58/93]MBO9135394.1 SyrB-like regulator [Rhizobium sp. B209b/85]MBO9171618.1 SyrB-like regulator [Rhizobium sp. L245/93]MBO9186636.1 SyrB-like regulator [Rhizobium sp. E27B/91]QXZ85986.1 SyrB-like regulator [Rhizobium sp. K1/93]